MLMLGPLGFATPWLLAALAALPILWVILRAMPPAPRLIRFPGTALLAGLVDRAPLASRTPWWLLLLRCLGLAALIAGLAGPVWRPAPTTAADGPLLVVMDGGWAAAPDWQQRTQRARAAIEAAGERPVALLMADGRATGALPFVSAAEAGRTLRTLTPAGWPTTYPEDIAATLTNAPQSGLQTLWISDGLDHPRRADWLTALTTRGTVRIAPPAAPVAALTLPAADPPALSLQLTAAPRPAVQPPAVLALGPDPQGVPRVLARLTPGPGQTAGGVTTHPVALDLPPELRNRVTRFEVEGTQSAGATWLADERTRRRKVALVDPGPANEGQALLAPLHYVRQALAPRTDLIEGGLGDLLQASPDVVVLTDTVVPPGDEALVGWVEKGGTLIRFAGPRMAGLPDLADDPLLPLRLRPGGRDIGGALSWGDPRGIAPFPADGPFAGLTPPADTAVRAQLMAEPGPEVAGRTLASLTDGTPLVSRAEVGQGQVVLIHVTANADWSDLPLSGLYVEMLTRLVQSSRASAAVAAAEGEAADAATFWTPVTILDGMGREAPASADLRPVVEADLANAPAPGIAPGLYRAGERERAINAGVALQPAVWTVGPNVALDTGAARAGIPLTGWALALALALFAVDAVASTLLARGHGPRPGSRRVAA